VNAPGGAGGTRRRGVRTGMIIAAGVVVLGGIGLALLIFSGGGRTYPTTPEGWAARWNAAAAEFGRTPGENWDLWLDVLSEIEGETDPAIVGPALDRMSGVHTVTVPIPVSIRTPTVLDDMLPQVGDIRDVLRAAVLPQIEASLESGDTDAAAEWIGRAWSLARVSDASGTLIGGLVQTAVIAATLETVRPHIRLAGAAGNRLAVVIADAPLTGTAWSLRMERELGLMLIQELAGDNLLIAGDQAATYEELMLDWALYESTGDPEALARVTAVFSRLQNSRLYALRRPGLDLILPAVDKARRTFRAVRTERDALLVMLALERFWDEQGSYPHALDQLVPEQLAAIPADPFADNAPLRYRLVDPDSDDPMTAYVLYSVGHNGTDEGGTENPSLVGRGLTDPDHGADHILNRLPPPPPPARPSGIIEDDPEYQPDEQPDEQPADQADEQPGNPAEAVP